MTYYMSHEINELLEVEKAVVHEGLGLIALGNGGDAANPSLFKYIEMRKIICISGLVIFALECLR